MPLTKDTAANNEYGFHTCRFNSVETADVGIRGSNCLKVWSNCDIRIFPEHPLQQCYIFT